MISIPQRWRGRAADLFGIDLRTLALFRVALATVVAGYVLARLPDTEAFFTDWGVLPRAALIELDSGARLSLYLVNGQWWFAALLELVTLACALALWLGYHSRAMIVALFVLVTSMINRNPLITIGGDSLLSCLLFWAMFLPLGARWSVDAALSTRPPPEQNLHLSPASAGLLLQVMSVYFFSAILKSAPDWWPDGTAVWYTMELERYASPWGRVLAQFPGVMHALSYFVYFLEALGPLLAFSPWLNRPLRFVVMLCFMGMHTGFILFMQIGHFPFVSLTSLTVLLGGWFWDWAGVRFDHGRRLRIYYDRDCGFCLKSCLLFRALLVLPRTGIEPAQDYARARALMEAQYSWVVIDSDDVAHTKWNAFVALLRHSLLFGWLAPLAALKVWERPGVAVYDWVGRHRGGFGRLTAFLLPPRAVAFEAGRLAQGFAAVMVALVLFWNLTTINLFPVPAQNLASPLFRILRIDQIWNMFAPYPSRLDGWVVFPGKLENGAEVDVLHPGQPLSWARPAYLSKVHENISWHTYRWRIYDNTYASQRLNYGKYLCREWNWTAAPGQHLLGFDMVYIKEITLPPGQTPVLERDVAWQHDCRPKSMREAPPPAPKEQQDPMENERRRPV